MKSRRLFNRVLLLGFGGITLGLMLFTVAASLTGCGSEATAQQTHSNTVTAANTTTSSTIATTVKATNKAESATVFLTAKNAYTKLNIVSELQSWSSDAILYAVMEREDTQVQNYFHYVASTAGWK